MYKHQILDPSDIKIDYKCNPQPPVDIPKGDVGYMAYEAFKALLDSYLSGIGHPRHPDVEAIVPNNVILNDSNDSVLRTRLFVQAARGSEQSSAFEKTIITVRIQCNGIPHFT
jgi:hypothetical protein